jgi:hypothetical protein
VYGFHPEKPLFAFFMKRFHPAGAFALGVRRFATLQKAPPDLFRHADVDSKTFQLHLPVNSYR